MGKRETERSHARLLKVQAVKREAGSQRWPQWLLGKQSEVPAEHKEGMCTLQS